ncbi:MAG: hypothetical protein ACK44L_17040 [Burkholderiales bacterium]
MRREGQWQISLNTDFDAVMRECAAPRPIRTAPGSLRSSGRPTASFIAGGMPTRSRSAKRMC